MKRSVMVFIPLMVLFTFMAVSFQVMPGDVSGAAEIGSISPAGTEDVENTFYGNLAGDDNTGRYCTFIGARAGSSGNNDTANTFLGYSSGWKNTGGGGNTFLGTYAGGYNVEGNNNTFIGRGAGYLNEIGHDNVCIGSRAGYNVKGSGNVFIGSHVGYTDASTDDKLYINSGSSDYPLIWGDFNTRNVVIYGGFRSIASHSASDQRLKKNIKPLQSSLDKISGLQGVSYEWNRERYPHMGLTEGKQIGLVAQDVEKVLPELLSQDKDGYKAVSYSKLTAVLVEAVKELKAENERQKEENKRQKTEIEKLRVLIKALQSG